LLNCDTTNVGASATSKSYMAYVKYNEYQLTKYMMYYYVRYERRFNPDTLATDVVSYSTLQVMQNWLVLPLIEDIIVKN
jgi:hypothetical protein